MKIRLQRHKFYFLISDVKNDKSEDVVLEEASTVDNSKAAPEGHRTNEKGRILTVWIVLGMLLCCVVWTLTVYLFCQKTTHAQEEPEVSPSLKCSSLPVEFRFVKSFIYNQ